MNMEQETKEELGSKCKHWETLGPKTDPAPKEESDHVTN